MTDIEYSRSHPLDHPRKAGTGAVGISGGDEWDMFVISIKEAA